MLLFAEQCSDIVIEKALKCPFLHSVLFGYLYSLDSILLEGGGILNWSALRSGIVNKVYAYIAPKLFGGADAKTPIEGMGTDSPAHAVMLGSSKVTKLGDDFLIECDVV